MPDGLNPPHEGLSKSRDLFGDLLVRERLMGYQLVGEVKAHQGYDG
jgi:hypothetical protein